MKRILLNAAFFAGMACMTTTLPVSLPAQVVVSPTPNCTLTVSNTDSAAKPTVPSGLSVTNPYEGQWGLRCDGEAADTLLPFSIRFQRTDPVNGNVDDPANKAAGDYSKRYTLRGGTYTVSITSVGGAAASPNSVTVISGNGGTGGTGGGGTGGGGTTNPPALTLGTVLVFNPNKEVAAGGKLDLSFSPGTIGIPAGKLQARLTLSPLGAAPTVALVDLTPLLDDKGVVIPLRYNPVVPSAPGPWSGVLEVAGVVISDPFTFQVFTPPTGGGGTGGGTTPAGPNCAVEALVTKEGVNVGTVNQYGFAQPLPAGFNYGFAVRSITGRAITPGGITNVAFGNGGGASRATGAVPAFFTVPNPGVNEVLSWTAIEGCGQVRANFPVVFTDGTTKYRLVPDPANVYEQGKVLTFLYVDDKGASPTNSYVADGWAASTNSFAVMQKGLKGAQHTLSFTATTDTTYKLQVWGLGDGWSEIAYVTVKAR